MEDLKRRHASDVQFIESKLKQLARPGLGKKPLSAEQIAEQRAKMESEIAIKHAKEIDELTQALLAKAQLSHQSDTPTSTTSATTATTTTITTGKTANDVADSEDEEDDDAEVGAGQSGAGNTDASSSSSSSSSSSTTPLPGSIAAKKLKAQRKREKKLQEAQAKTASASNDGADGPSLREIENTQLNKTLGPMGFSIKTVAADGHCLFRAVADQLRMRATAAAGAAVAATVPDHAALRVRAAEYIRMKWGEFAPFLPYEPSDGYPDTDVASPQVEQQQQQQQKIQAAVVKYCERLISSGCWGGHPEVRALSSTIGLPIIIYQAAAAPLEFRPSGSESSDLSRGGAGGDYALRLSFHRHYLALGEHYNSVVRGSAGNGGGGGGGGGTK